MAVQDRGGISAGDIATLAAAQGKITLDISGDVKQSMLDFISTANRMVSGSKLGQYFGDTETLVKRLGESVRACKKDFSDFNAKEVVNTFNALKVRAGDADLAPFFKKFEGGFRNIMDTVDEARGKVGSFVEGFHEADFSRLFSSYDKLKEYAQTLGASEKEVESLMKRLAELSTMDAGSLVDQLSAARKEISELKRQLDTSSQNQIIRELQAALEEMDNRLTSTQNRLREFRDTAVNEFKDFLRANEINPDAWNFEEGRERFAEYFDNIETGYMTARQAIAAFKSEYSELFQMGNDQGGLFSSAQVEQFQSRLEEIFAKVQEISEYIRSGGGNVNGIVAPAVDKDLEAIQKDESALRHIIDEGGELSHVGEIVEGVANAAADGMQKIGNLSDQTVSLVQSLTELSRAGEDSLASLSLVFRHIGNVENLKVSTEEFTKLKTALETLKDLTGIEKIGTLSGIDLSGFSGLSISKASMNNLADFITSFANSNIDVGKLKELGTVDLTNFGKQNLSVSKATMDNLTKLLTAFNGGADTGAATQATKTAGSELAQAAEKVTETVRQENNVLREGGKVLQEHVADEQAAVQAEADKKRISELLAEALKREEEATERAGRATERAAQQESQYVNTTMKRVFDLQRSIVEAKNKLGDITGGKERPEYDTYNKLISILEEVIQKYYQYQQILKDNPENTAEATKVLDISQIWESMADVATRFAEARDKAAEFSFQTKKGMAESKAAAQDFLKELNTLSTITGKGAWDIFDEKLKKIEKDFRAISDPSDALRQKMDDLRNIINVLSDPNADPTAKLSAYNQLKDAIEGVSLSIKNEANAQREAAQIQKELANSAKSASDQYERLNTVFASLQNKSKFDTSSFERMRDLMAQVNDTSLSTDQRQSALQQLNALLDESSQKLHALAEAEAQEERQANASAESERQRQGLLKQLNNLLIQCTNAERKFSAAQNIGSLKQTYTTLKETTSGVKELIAKLESGKMSMSEASREAQKLGVSFSTCNRELKTNSSLLGRYVTTGMQQLKSRLQYTLGLAAMVYKAVGEIKKMISTAVELDSAMNTLQIVTKASGSEMEAYGKRVSSMAKETAQATKDLIDATTVYARLGYSMEESATLSKYTAMLQGVGDIGATEAQNAMTAIIKAFGKNVNEIEDVMDKLVVVGNNFPISVSQLAEGMNNAGSMLAVAGNSFEESVALLTAANTTIQNISKASTGLRTIAARIRKTTTGEDGDEIVEESKYNDMVAALTKYKVTLVDANGEYRKTYDVIRDIAAVWKQMTSMEQAAVVEALAGTRQQNIFASLMTQFGEAEGALERMNDSAGELQSTYDIYLNSIQAHVQTMKAAYDELAKDFVDSSLAKGALDILTKIIELLDFLVSKIGAVNALVGGIGIAVVVRNFEKIQKLLAQFQIYRAGGWLFDSPFAKIGSLLGTIPPQLTIILGGLTAIVAVLATIKRMRSLEYATKQVEETAAEIKKLTAEQDEIQKRIVELNDLKARGDFTVQQATELNILQAQNTALEAQINLLKQRNAHARSEEREAAIRDANELLGIGATGVRPVGPAASAITTDTLTGALANYKQWEEESKKHPETKWIANKYKAASDKLEESIKSASLLMGKLDPEEDKELILALGEAIQMANDSVAGISKELRSARTELELIQKDGNVDLLNRPVVDTKVLEAAGWGSIGDESGATVYSSTYSNEDNTIAMNFTPIIVDQNGNYVGVLTPEQLRQYAEGVIAGTQKDNLNLKIGATFEGPDALQQAEQEAEKVHELHELVYENDLRKIQTFHREVNSLSKSTIDAIRKYVSDGTKLTKEQADALRTLTERLKEEGFTVEQIANMFSQMFAEAPSNGIEEVTQKSISGLATFRDELSKTNQALEEYKKAMEGGEKDDAVKSAAEIYKGALEDITSGRVDSNRMHAAAKLFFDREFLDSIEWNMERVAQELQGDIWKYLFDPDDQSEYDYGQRFAEAVKQNFSRADGVWMDNNTFYYDSLEKVAKAFNMSTSAASMFLAALDMYGVNTMRSTEENTELIASFRSLQDELGGADAALRQIVEDMHTQGMDEVEIHAVLGDLQQGGFINLESDELHATISDVLAGLEEVDKTSADPEVGMNASPFVQGYNEVVQLLNELDRMYASPTVDMNYTNNEPASISGSGSKSGGKNIDATAGASGIPYGHAGGKTLVNELGPELISDNGEAFIANGGKPGFVTLSKDAIVFDAEETAKILGGGAYSGKHRAFADGSFGSRNGLRNRLLSGGRTRAMRVASDRGTVSHAVTYWTCPFCGHQNPQTASRCQSCGKDPRSSVTTTPVQNDSGTTYYVYQPVPESTQYYEWLYDEPESDSYYEQLEQQAREEERKREEERREAERRQRELEAALAAQQVNNNKKSTAGGKLAGTGGGNYVGGADYDSSNPEKVDWIAVRINRLQRTIADLEKVATSGFKKLDKRLEATKDQIAKTTEEIDVMNSAYARYIDEANSVGLDDYTAELVRNGAIDISQYDDETRKQIDEYMEWYEKALDAQSSIEELHQNIAQMYVDAFDMVQTDFENQLAQIEHDVNMTSKNLEMAQKRGYIDSAKYYEEMAESQTLTINKLKVELQDLQKYRDEAMASGEIEEGSEAWYEMQASINEVEEAIADANIQLVDYQRTIRSIDWSHFDYAIDRLNQMASETQFLIDLMSHHELFDENGQFNDLGEATAGLHAVNYDMYMAEADEYAKEMQKIQQELEQDPYDTELISRREELLNLQRQSITSAEQEKEAVKSLVQEGINIELNALKDLIDTYQKNLDSAKDLYEYQKKITEKTADMASIQKQLSAYSNDTSEETRAKVQKLQNDLKNADKELREAEWEQNISDQKKLLDEMYDEYEDYLNQRLDNIDLLMQEMITGTNENMDSIRNTLNEVGAEVGYTVTDTLNQAMSNDLSYYDHVFEGMNSIHVVLEDIYSMVGAMAQASGAVKAYATGGLVDYTGLAAVHGSKSRPELMLNANDTENFLEAARMMRDLLTTSSPTSLPGFDIGGSGITIGQFQVNIPIERVLDYNELVSQMQADPKFEKLINAMTLDRTLGKSSLGKNRIRF